MKYWQQGLGLLVMAVICQQALARTAPVEERLSVGDRLSRIEAILENQQKSDLPQHFLELQKSYQTLQGKWEEMAHELAELTKKQRTLYNDVDSRLNRISQSNVAADKALDGIKPRESTPIASKERSIYQHAYKMLRAKQYKAAISELQHYIAAYPKGVYAPNAYYWLGEVYHLEGQLKPAKQAFKTVVDHFPNHPKAADALLKLGYVYSAIGDRKAATLALEDVSKRYSGTSLAQLADARLKRLNRH